MVNYLNRQWEAAFSSGPSSWRPEKKAVGIRTEPMGRACSPTEISRAQAPGRIAESDPAPLKDHRPGGASRWGRAARRRLRTRGERQWGPIPFHPSGYGTVRDRESQPILNQSSRVSGTRPLARLLCKLGCLSFQLRFARRVSRAQKPRKEPGSAAPGLPT